MRLKKIDMVISCCRECPYMRGKADVGWFFCIYQDCELKIKNILIIHEDCLLENLDMPVGMTQIDHDKD